MPREQPAGLIGVRRRAWNRQVSARGRRAAGIEAFLGAHQNLHAVPHGPRRRAPPPSTVARRQHLRARLARAASGRKSPFLTRGPIRLSRAAHVSFCEFVWATYLRTPGGCLSTAGIALRPQRGSRLSTPRAMWSSGFERACGMVVSPDVTPLAGSAAACADGTLVPMMAVLAAAAAPPALRLRAAADCRFEFRRGS